MNDRLFEAEIEKLKEEPPIPSHILDQFESKTLRKLDQLKIRRKQVFKKTTVLALCFCFVVGFSFFGAQWIHTIVALEEPAQETIPIDLEDWREDSLLNLFVELEGMEFLLEVDENFYLTELDLIDQIQPILTN